MSVTQSNCMLSSKYGDMAVDARGVVSPQTGILKQLGLTGSYENRLGTIKWSNGVEWSRGAGMVERRLLALEQSLATERTARVTLETRVTQLENCCAQNGGGTNPSGPTGNTTPTTPATPTQDTITPRVDALETKVGQLENCCAGNNSTGGTTPTTGGDSNSTGDGALGDRLDELNATLLSGAMRGPAGYCMTEPNVTKVYVPVTRFTYTYNANTEDCVLSNVQANQPNVDLNQISDKCIWSSNVHTADPTKTYAPMVAFTGDKIAFRRTSKAYNVWQLAGKNQWNKCDFKNAKLIAGVLDFDGLERQGGKGFFELALTQPGTYYFASDKQGQGDPARREYCWSKFDDGTSIGHPGKGSWGQSLKMKVIVQDPDDSVMATCPLYDPAKYGVTGGGEVDSETVTKLKGAVSALVRGFINNELRTTERVRNEGHSGVTTVRSYNHGLDAYQAESHVGGSGCLNMHNHADLQYTIGLGEFQAVLNGVQFATRHNDYSMLMPDDTKTTEDFISEWPPPAVDMPQPSVPPSVTAAGNVNAQNAEMREYFKAFLEQDKTIRDYTPFFLPVLCYLEGAWTVKADEIAEPFSSDRHQIAADTWQELYGKNVYTFNSGLKDTAENLPFLPTAILGQRLDDEGQATFEPIEAQWFYRISCIPLKDDKGVTMEVPTARFRVKNELHVQARGSKPQTREELAKTKRPLFEVNPVIDNYNPKAVWPKNSFKREFMDVMMEQIPGFDGPNGYLTDETFGPRCGAYDDSSVTLNTAYYTRHLAYQGLTDAMGRTTSQRNFNDWTYAAQTHNKNVIQFTTCSDVNLDATRDSNDVLHVKECEDLKDKEDDCRAKKWDSVGGGGTNAFCSWQGSSGSNNGACAYKKCWKQRWSHAIPLEIIYLTPLHEWNPYNIKKDCTDAEVNTGGANGKQATPTNCASRRNWYLTPASFFLSDTSIDPADTSGGVRYTKDQSGQVREVRASGHYIHFPEIQGVGLIRQRYPIFPVHAEGGTTYKEVKALQDLVVGTQQELTNDNDPYLGAILKETRGYAYGIELRVTEGSGHEHTLAIGAGAATKLMDGTDTEYKGTSTLANGHTHRMQVGYDKTAKTWSLIWCTMSPDDCPSSITSGCGTAADATGVQVSCCYAKCPDNHLTVLEA